MPIDHAFARLPASRDSRRPRGIEFRNELLRAHARAPSRDPRAAYELTGASGRPVLRRGRRHHVAVLVGHGLGVDEALVLDDLAVLACKPHLLGPFGVSISMHTSRLPPMRTSILATGTVALSGPYHSLKCSGSVHLRQHVSGCSWRPIGCALNR